LPFNASAGGKVGEIRILPFVSFSLDEQTNELRKKAHLKDIMDFVTKIVKNGLSE
jgi:hypothetical protein